MPQKTKTTEEYAALIAKKLTESVGGAFENEIDQDFLDTASLVLAEHQKAYETSLLDGSPDRKIQTIKTSIEMCASQIVARGHENKLNIKKGGWAVFEAGLEEVAKWIIRVALGVMSG